jgi:hypothetical protein
MEALHDQLESEYRFQKPFDQGERTPLMPPKAIAFRFRTDMRR